MEKEQDRHEWRLLIIILSFSLVISILAIFQLLWQVGKLEAKVIDLQAKVAEQNTTIAIQSKTIADDALRNRLFGGIGG